jgi:hypothetical protein
LRCGIDLPEDTPNPAVGVLGISDGDPWKRVPVVVKAAVRRKGIGKRRRAVRLGADPPGDVEPPPAAQRQAAFKPSTRAAAPADRNRGLTPPAGAVVETPAGQRCVGDGAGCSRRRYPHCAGTCSARVARGCSARRT